jgi:hypothetical protein
MKGNLALPPKNDPALTGRVLHRRSSIRMLLTLPAANMSRSAPAELAGHTPLATDRGAEAINEEVDYVGVPAASLLRAVDRA